MLRNKSNVTVDLKWVGKEIALLPGQTLDVAETFGNIILEDRFMSKFPGKLEKGNFVIGGGPDECFVSDATMEKAVEKKEPEKIVEQVKHEVVKHAGRPKKR